MKKELIPLFLLLIISTKASPQNSWSNQDFDCSLKIKGYHRDSICSNKYEMEYYRTKGRDHRPEKLKEITLSK